MSTITSVDGPFSAMEPVVNESGQSAVSWAAVFAGAFVAVAVTLVLVLLGAGLGLTSISPWPGVGASAGSFSIAAGIGLIVVQWLASATGGYITGRLRTNWVGVHSHEVFFRDTAHGFLSWSLATVAGSLLLAGVTASAIGGGVHATATGAFGAAQAASSLATSGLSGYEMDSLFRSDKPEPAAAGTNVLASNAQAGRIIANAVSAGALPAADRSYLAQMIATRTGISQADAEKRVDDGVARAKAAEAKARQVADAARKSAAEFAIFTALSLLIGAFIASAAAAYAGSLRDEPAH